MSIDNLHLFVRGGQGTGQPLTVRVAGRRAQYLHAIQQRLHLRTKDTDFAGQQALDKLSELFESENEEQSVEELVPLNNLLQLRVALAQHHLDVLDPSIQKIDRIVTATLGQDLATRLADNRQQQRNMVSFWASQINDHIHGTPRRTAAIDQLQQIAATVLPWRTKLQIMRDLYLKVHTGQNTIYETLKIGIDELENAIAGESNQREKRRLSKQLKNLVFEIEPYPFLNMKSRRTHTDSLSAAGLLAALHHAILWDSYTPIFAIARLQVLMQGVSDIQASEKPADSLTDCELHFLAIGTQMLQELSYEDHGERELDQAYTLLSRLSQQRIAAIVDPHLRALVCCYTRPYYQETLNILLGENAEIYSTLDLSSTMARACAFAYEPKSEDKTFKHYYSLLLKQTKHEPDLQQQIQSDLQNVLEARAQTADNAAERAVFQRRLRLIQS